MTNHDQHPHVTQPILIYSGPELDTPPQDTIIPEPDTPRWKLGVIGTVAAGAIITGTRLLAGDTVAEEQIDPRLPSAEVQGPSTTSTLPVPDNPAGLIAILGDSEDTHTVTILPPKGMPTPADGVMDAGFEENLQGSVFTAERVYHVYPGRRADQTIDCLVGEIVRAEPGDSISGLNYEHYNSSETMDMYRSIIFEHAAVELNIAAGVIDAPDDIIRPGDPVRLLSLCVVTVHLEEEKGGPVLIFQGLIPHDEASLEGVIDGHWGILNPDIEE